MNGNKVRIKVSERPSFTENHWNWCCDIYELRCKHRLQIWICRKESGKTLNSLMLLRCSQWNLDSLWVTLFAGQWPHQEDPASLRGNVGGATLDGCSFEGEGAGEGKKWSLCCSTGLGTSQPFVPHLIQALAIKEHIGYPDHILQERNQKLDQEYAHVSKSWVLLPLSHCWKMKACTDSSPTCPDSA